MHPLQPPELVRGLLAPSEAEAWRGTWFLLVRVLADDADLREWLRTVATSGGTNPVGSRESMPYSTSTVTVASMRLRLAQSRPAWSPASVAADRAQHEIFIVPLRKRGAETNPFAERISVGRAPNNDVVLRHHTVSKFQAWFEVDDEGHLWLADAGSTNTTRVDGHQLIPRSAEKVGLGVELRFGDVVCAAVDMGFVTELLGRTQPARGTDAR